MDHYVTAVHRAMAFMEENLTRPVTLEAISRRAGFSLWHFQRIFSSHVGETLGACLRRRRLSVAVLDLRNTRRSILDVAFDYQFESHAAFTRAFQATFGATPSSFRRLRHTPQLLPSPAVPALSHLIHMKPKIQKLPALTLLGLEARFFGPMSEHANNHKVIPPLYGRFFARKPELPPALDHYNYGAARPVSETSRTREDELVYLAGQSVPPRTPAPTGTAIWRLPARTYAIFRHRGPVVRIDETLGYIYGTWLPNSDYELAGDFSIERYDESFCDGGEKSQFEILIPVKKRRTLQRKRASATR
ncbi:MAG TPA: GyrI-like domain-containing protein [Opitutaceae bacterium]|nr:GyrI-like domain-containing protein [Opitutaceae bacterium]